MELIELDRLLDLMDETFWSQAGIFKSDEEY